MSQSFAIIYAPIVKEHLRIIKPKYYSLIRNRIKTMLSFDPDVEAVNRKPLKWPIMFGGEWEVRFGPDNRFRVYYRIDHEAHEVHILAIGFKIRNRLFIGDREVEL